MIARGLLLLCAVAMSQAFFSAPQPIQPLVPIPIMKPMVRTKVVPIVKYIRQPVYIERIVRVPHYIERAIPVPYRSGSAGSAGVAGAAAGGDSNLNFGLNAQIEDADTVNIQAGVSGFSGHSNNNNNFNNNNNDDGYRGVIGGGRSRGIHRQVQPRISVSQTSIAQPQTRIAQPQFGRGGYRQHKMPSHFGRF